jgi:Fur family peroxide stress response transcriptional regulator
VENDSKRPATVLKKYKIKPSYQRIRIYEYLASHFIHPTAEQIYADLKTQIPTLSKSTVYTTLKAFVKAGIVREITIEDNTIRYEFNIQDHGHFKCEECGKIYDFSIDTDSLCPDELKEFQVNDKNVYFKGICQKCLQRQEPENSSREQ